MARSSSKLMPALPAIVAMGTVVACGSTANVDPTSSHERADAGEIGGSPATGDASAAGGSSHTDTGGTGGTYSVGGAPSADPKPPIAGPITYVAGFVVHVRPSSGQIDVEPATPPTPGGDLFASAISAPPGTFDLAADDLGTDAQCPDGFKTSSVCFRVRVSHSLARSVDNVFAQAVGVVDPASALPAEGIGALNYDPAEFGLEPTHGLWKYTAPGSTTPGVLGQAPKNTGSRTWVFASETHADVDLTVRVVASLGYPKYLFDFSEQPFVDACAGGKNLGQPLSAPQDLPFPFVLYGVTASGVVIGSRGTITLGPDAPAITAVNTNLPSTAAPWATIFAFWDQLVYGGAGSALCTMTLGTAPNRRFIVTWKDMDFGPGVDAGAHLTFSALLSEGSNRVDLVYQEMVGPTPRAMGSSATVGVQDEARTAAAGAFETADFSSGAAYALIPHP